MSTPRLSDKNRVPVMTSREGPDSQGFTASSTQQDFLPDLEDSQDKRAQFSKKLDQAADMAMRASESQQHTAFSSQTQFLPGMEDSQDSSLQFLECDFPSDQHAIQASNNEIPMASVAGFGGFSRPDGFDKPEDMTPIGFQFSANNLPRPNIKSINGKPNQGPSAGSPALNAGPAAFPPQQRSESAPKSATHMPPAKAQQPRMLPPIHEQAQAQKKNMQKLMSPRTSVAHASPTDKQPPSAARHAKSHLNTKGTNFDMMAQRSSAKKPSPLSPSLPDMLNQEQDYYEPETIDLSSSQQPAFDVYDMNGEPTSDGSAGTAQDETVSMHGHHENLSNELNGSQESNAELDGMPFPDEYPEPSLRPMQNTLQPSRTSISHPRVHHDVNTGNTPAAQRTHERNASKVVARSEPRSKVPHGTADRPPVPSPKQLTPEKVEKAEGYRSISWGSRRQNVQPVGDLAFPGSSGSPVASRPHRLKPEAQMNRPMRKHVESQIVESVLRPPSRASNISRQRHPRQRQTARCERDSSVNDAPALDENFRDFSQSWNRYFSKMQQEKIKTQTEIKELNEAINEQKEVIQELEDQIAAQDTETADLNDENQQLRRQVRDVEKRMEESSSKIKKLDEKCHVYKDRLNDAIDEQQRLYTKTKEFTQRAIAEIRLEEQGRKESMEKALKTSEDVRAEIQKKIGSLSSEARTRAENLEKTIATLNVSLEERQRELAREKDTIKTLRKELSESRQANDQTLQTISNQNERILKAVKQHRGHAEDAELSFCEQNEKLTTMMKVLQEVKTKTSHPTTILEQIGVLRDEGVNSVLAEIQRMVASQSASKTDNEAVSEKIELIKNICEQINQNVHNGQEVEQINHRYQQALFDLQNSEQARKKSEEKLEEFIRFNTEFYEENQQLSQHVDALQAQLENFQGQEEVIEQLNEQIADLQGQVETLQGHEEDNEQLQQQVTALQSQLQSHRNQGEENGRLVGLVGTLQTQVETLQGQEKEREELQKKVASLQSQIKAMQKQAGSGQDIKEQVSRLQQLLTEKNNEITKTDHKVKSLEEQLKDRDTVIRNDRQRSKQALDTANQQHEKDVTNVVQHERQKAQEAQRDLERRLEASEKARSKLEQDLQKANDKIEGLSSGQDSVAEELRKLKDNVAQQMEQVTELSQGVGASGESQERLRGQLEQWFRDRVQVVQMEKVVQRMGRDHSSILEVISAEKQRGDTNSTCHTQTERTPKANLRQKNVSCDVESSPLSELPSSMPPSPSESQRDRRVVIRTPVEEEAVPPPSVEQERELRRQSQPLRPIIKRPITRKRSKELEEEENAAKAQVVNQQPSQPSQRSISKSSVSTHSSYNRPVLGGVSSTASGSNNRRSSQRASKNSTLIGKRSRTRVASSQDLSLDSQGYARDVSQSQSSSRRSGGSTSQDRLIKRQRTMAVQEQDHDQETIVRRSGFSASSQYFANNGNDDEDDISEEDLSTTKVMSKLPVVGQRGAPLQRPQPNLARTYGSQSSQGSERMGSHNSALSRQSLGHS